MTDEIYVGVRDTQTPEQKAKNYNQSEMVTTFAPVIWTEKTKYRSFPIRDQDGSGQCVVMTEAKELGVIAEQKYGKYIDFSSSFLYQKRKYPETPGCTSEDVYSIFPEAGDVLESMMPSQKMTDAQAMAVPKEPYYDDLAKLFKAKRIEMAIDFETVASTIQATGKAVMIWVKFSTSEWTDFPTVSDKPITSGHSITVVDYTLIKGKKYLVIDDSWGLGYAVKGQRFISEEYFKARCFLASYKMNFTQQNNATIPTRPIFDGSIKSAQDCLKWEGLFPGNVPSTGVWGNISRTACIAFQKRFGIVQALGNLGPITKAKLSELYK